MRIIQLTLHHELRIAADAPAAVVAEIWHHVLHADGVRIYTPVGCLTATPRPGDDELVRHWQADLWLRGDIPADLVPPSLITITADWLLAATACTEPLLVNLHECRNTDYLERGQLCPGG